MLRGAQHWARRRRRSRRPDLGEVGNVGSPEGFTASLQVEVGEQVTADLWTGFGGQQRSEERARGRRSELATVTSLRPRFWRESERKEEMDASTSPGVSPWRSCVVRSWRVGPETTYGRQMSPLFCRRSATSTSSALIQTKRWLTDRATLTAIISQTKAN